MNFTLHQLQIFTKITEHQSITKAAEELHLTQPAVSIQLKNFQDQFQIPLTEVINKQLFITEFGWEIAEAAKNILNEAYAINYKTEAFKGLITGRLRVSVVSTGKYVMPYFLSGFINKHPGIELQMDVTNKQRVISNIKENSVDFSLVSVLPEAVKIERMDLLSNKLFLVGNTQKKFNKRPYDKSIFMDLPLIFRENGSGTRQTMEKFIEGNNVSVIKKLELTSNEAVKQAVIAGLGFSIMPLIGIRNELQNKVLQIIPVKGLPVQSTWSLIWQKDKKLSPVAQAFLNHLEGESKQIIANTFDWYENYGNEKKSG